MKETVKQRDYMHENVTMYVLTKSFWVLTQVKATTYIVAAE